jgi:hypothetical protein
MSMRMRLLPTIALCTVAAVLAAAAGASISDPAPLPASTVTKQGHKKPKTQGFPVGKSPDLWATINVCDTDGNPNTIGIRGSMPGLRKKRAALQIRFRVQYQKGDGEWKNTDESADSGWRTIGHTRTEVIETGQDFTFQPPETGAHTLRGAVSYRWTRKGKQLKALRRLTEVGHRSTAGADPAGYSAATCRITAP